MPASIDGEKARTLLIFLARANKKILEKKHALKALHEEIQELKRVTKKSARARVNKLEERILETLKQGGFITKYDEEERSMPEKVSDEIIDEKKREEKLQEIEARAQAQAREASPITIDELKSMLRRLEHVRKKIKVKGADEKIHARLLGERIKDLRRKIAARSSDVLVMGKKHATKVRRMKKVARKKRS